ncbi:MAG: hypothetical protein IJZ29_04880 [Clostridia bacterium]|nr:hypothetical protein [Clostridia bacterium]
MSKCIFCDEEIVKADKEKAKQVGLQLEKSKNNLLSIFYQHIFDYCPNCKMVELILTDSEKKVLLDKKGKVFEILNNKELEGIDENKAIRQAEVKGYACELLNDNVGAVLGYKASVDLLNAYINNFLEERAKSVLNKDGKSFKILDRSEMKTFEYAKQHRDLLNRLILGKFDESVFSSIGILGFLIFIDTILDLTELGVQDDKMLAYASRMLESLKKEDLKEEFKPVVDELENKYLSIMKSRE